MVPRFSGRLESMAALLRRRPFGLISDVDGTISAIAPTPEEAVVDGRCREALRMLAGRLDLVAVVSGRPAAQVREMVGVEGIVYVGNHGLEWWRDGVVALSPSAARYQPIVARGLAEVRARLAPAGLIFEDKGIVAAVHYRGSPRPDAARAVILAVAGEVAEARGLIVAEGKMVVELRPPVAHDKGTAVETLVAEHHLRSVLYLGDDWTDAAAFRKLRALRRAGQCAGVAIAVAGPEAPRQVLAAADCRVDGVAGVAEVLEGIAEQAGIM